MERLRMTVAPGTLTSLSKAGSRTSGYDHIVGNGDLSQLGQQMIFFRNRGFDVGNWDVYPAVRTEEDKKLALAALFKSRGPGWWNMRHEYVKLGICTPEELGKALDSL
jgi:hypothetical protein